MPLPRNLPHLCVALGFSSVAELSKAAEQEYRDGSTLFEFRLDYLPDPAAALPLIRKFRDAHAEAHVLATCRHRRAQGHFGGSPEKQLAVLRSSAEAGASLLDIEIETAEKHKTEVAKLRELAPVIVSYHNFKGTPALEATLRRLRRVPADLYKIATTARKPSDNLRVMRCLREHDRQPLIALAMSEAGMPTRILASAIGSVFTYAAPLTHHPTAPGQLTAHMLRSLYRSEKLSKQSRVFGVIAEPVAHSLSPFLHNRAFQAKRIDAVYLPFLVERNKLADWMSVASALPVCGFSVTIPHKCRMLHHLNLVDPLARRIGAVNTVWRKAGKWRGANTDAEGVLTPLTRRCRLANSSVLIAGYGGAARAAAVALQDARAKVFITGRNSQEAQRLARVVKGEALSLKQAAAQHFDVLVHATPLGMHPNVNQALFNDRIPAELVLDMVYNPAETLLLRHARAQGCEVIPGAEMLLEQAAAQFEIWTGETAPRDVMRTALEAHL